MYNPSICMHIVTDANPVSIAHIESYAIAYTVYLWLQFQSERACRRYFDADNKEDKDRAEIDVDRIRELYDAALLALSRITRRVDGVPPKAWRRWYSMQKRKAEIIRRHWDASTGLFVWGKTTYGL